MSDLTDSYTMYTEGESASGPDDVTFTYWADVQRLASSTSAPPGFRWRWIVAGTFGLPRTDGQTASVEGSAVVGLSPNAMHALISGAGASSAIYGSWPCAGVEIERLGSAGVLNKRPRGLLMDFPDGATIGAKMVGEFLPSGRTWQAKREATFAEEIQAWLAAGRTASPVANTPAPGDPRPSPPVMPPATPVSTPPVTEPGTPPGWYSNPVGTGLRWWDGSTWTDATAPSAEG